MTVHETPMTATPSRHAAVPDVMPRQVRRRRTGRVLVVGIDGSASARHAAFWAAREAVRRHAALSLVFAYSLPAAGYSGYNPYPADMLGTMSDDGQAVLDEVAAAVHAAHPELDVTTEVVHCDPATALRRAADGAVLTVLGGHHRSRVATALGSLAAKLVARNPSPVAVVPDGEEPGTGPVVVGVDGSPASEGAISFAFEAASLRHAPLTAVHCWTDPAGMSAVTTYTAMLADPDPIEESERSLLSERLAGWSEKYPDVAVERVLTRQGAVFALGDLASSAQLLVIGTRGHAGLAGLLAGSTGQTLIGHSSVPVVVVRPPQ
jgi:nucleotide-binding universal stress UspA family protein